MNDRHEDTKLLDYLENITCNRVVMRWSTTGRGWRLHETPGMEGYTTVRAALRAFIKEDQNSWEDVE